MSEDNKYSKTGIITKIITNAPDGEDRIEFMPDDMSRVLQLPESRISFDGTEVKEGDRITISPTDIRTGKPIPYDDFVRQLYDISHGKVQPSEVSEQNAPGQQAGNTIPTKGNESDQKLEEKVDKRNNPNFDLNNSRNSVQNQPTSDQNALPDEKSEEPDTTSADNINAKSDKEKKNSPKQLKRQAKSDHIVLGISGVLSGILELVGLFLSMTILTTGANVLFVFSFIYSIFTIVRTKKYAHKFALLALIISLISLAGYGINIPVLPMWGLYVKMGLGVLMIILSLLDMFKKASILLDENQDE